MKKARVSRVLLSILLFSAGSLALGVSNVVERANLSSRAYPTWEGLYKFTGDFVIKIKGMTDLHVLQYRRAGHEGVLIDFAVPHGEGELKLLVTANANLKGVVPLLEGVDVFPRKDEAEIIVQWRHPGNGGLRTVDKYRYTQRGLILIDRAHFMDVGEGMQWISDDALNRWVEQRSPKDTPSVRTVVPQEK